MNGNAWADRFRLATAESAHSVAEREERDRLDEEARRTWNARMEKAFVDLAGILRSWTTEASPGLAPVPISYAQNPNGTFSISLGNVVGTLALKIAQNRLDVRLSSACFDAGASHLLFEYSEAAGDRAADDEAIFPVHHSSPDEPHPIPDEWLYVKAVPSDDSVSWRIVNDELSVDALAQAVLDRIGAYYIKRNITLGHCAWWEREHALDIQRARAAAGSSPENLSQRAFDSRVGDVAV